MRMTIQDADVIVAHRVAKNSVKPRPMVVRCTQGLHETVFSFTKHLKDLENENGDKYYVCSQHPEPIVTDKKLHEDKLRAIPRTNAQIPKEEQEAQGLYAELFSFVCVL